MAVQVDYVHCNWSTCHPLQRVSFMWWMDVRMDVSASLFNQLILSLDVWTYNWTKFNQKWVGASRKTLIQDTIYSEDYLQRYGCNNKQSSIHYHRECKSLGWLEHVGVNMKILLCTQCDRTLCSLYTLAFKGYLDKGLKVDKGENLYKAKLGRRCYFGLLHQKSKGHSRLRAHVSEVY